jgi:hypothetical protein
MAMVYVRCLTKLVAADGTAISLFMKKGVMLFLRHLMPE